MWQLGAKDCGKLCEAPGAAEEVSIAIKSLGGVVALVDMNWTEISILQAAPRPPLKLDVYVGLSPSYCFCHYADRDFYVGADLLASQRGFDFVDNWWKRVG
jgi:hypothetical protein